MDWNVTVMLDEQKIDEIAQKVASANLTSTNVTSVSSSPTIDSLGHDALRITIVLKSGAESTISGEAALDTLVGITDQLRRAGEERLAIIEYATKEELDASGDS
jgi:hypothetical protein